MSGQLGSLVVEVAANVARFQSDMGKMAQIAQNNANQMQRAFDVVGTSLKAMGAGFAMGLTIDKVTAGINEAIKSAAGMQQLAERTGASAEGLSGLARVARLSGTDTEALATGLQKLSKSMVDMQNGGAATAAAFKAIGISAKDIQSLSPDATFKLIAQRLAQYSDGAGKTATAQQLLGKSGANLLPVMKDLAEVGDAVVNSNSRFIEQADNYQKSLVRLELAQDKIYKRIAGEVIPVMQAFADTMLESAKQGNALSKSVNGLAADDSLRSWAERGAMAVGITIESLTALLKFGRAVAGSFQVMAADIALPFEMANAAASGGTIGARVVAIKKAMDERNKVVSEANARYDELWNGNLTAFTDGLRKRLDAQRKSDAYGGGPGGSGPGGKKQTVDLKTSRDMVAATVTGYDAIVASTQRYMAEAEAMLDIGHKLNDVDKWRIKQLADLDKGTEKRTYMATLNARVGIEAAASMMKQAEAQNKAIQMEADMQKLLSDKGLIGGKKTDYSTERDTAITKYLSGLVDDTRRAESLVNGSFQRMEDAVVQFAQTGKLNFSGLWSYMAEEYLRNLVRMTAKDMLTDKSGAFIGFAGMASGISGWLSSFSGHANGLPYVPYDNYPAMLHEGEKVLTKAEVQGGAWSGGSSISIGAGQVINIGQGVSRAEVYAAVNKSNALSREALMRSLRQQGVAA